VDDEKTNRFPLRVVAPDLGFNSVPIKSLTYGFPVRGMKPKVPRGKPETLERMCPIAFTFKEAHSEGQIDFKTKNQRFRRVGGRHGPIGRGRSAAH